MKLLIINYLPYLLSILTIYTYLQIGHKERFVWIISFCGQVFWFIWVIVSQTWGLIPLEIALTIIFVRNYILWGKGAVNEVV